MQNKDRIIFQKIIKYISDVKEYVGEMGYYDFLQDKKTITACAFSILQIGELASEISDEAQEKYNDVNIPWKAIRGMRNRIVHGYENVDLMVLWKTIENSLPELKVKIEKILFDETEGLF